MSNLWIAHKAQVLRFLRLTVVPLVLLPLASLALSGGLTRAAVVSVLTAALEVIMRAYRPTVPATPSA